MSVLFQFLFYLGVLSSEVGPAKIQQHELEIDIRLLYESRVYPMYNVYSQKVYVEISKVYIYTICDIIFLSLFAVRSIPF